MKEAVDHSPTVMADAFDNRIVKGGRGSTDRDNRQGTEQPQYPRPDQINQRRKKAA